MATYKIVIVGNANTGKTSLLNRYINDEFTNYLPPTIGIEFTHKDSGDETKLVIWDTAGQERFNSITSTLYRDADAILYVYDVSNPESFTALAQWHRQGLTHCNRDAVQVLVGNKIDLSTVVDSDVAKSWARERSMFYETACPKDGTGCVLVFSTIVSQLNRLPRVREAKIRVMELPTTDRCCY
tara:strand:- start:112 stop:663 length:552 start_codon:yes stop_codon:yes gene_type:complete